MRKIKIEKRIISGIFIQLTLVVLSTAACAQKPIDPGNEKSLHQFFDGYNKQDFEQMREPLSGILAALLTEQRLMDSYGSFYQIFGKAEIKNLRSNSENYLLFDIAYSKDTTELHSMGLAFTKKHKIIGMNSKNPKFTYPIQVERKPLPAKTIQAKIDSMLNLKEAAGVFSGCVLVIDSGSVIYKNCSGYSNRATKAELNENSIFELASCSKQFTATAILILAEQQKLNLTDEIQKFFPALPYKGITIGHLLTHTSGLPTYEDLMEKYWDKTKIATNKDVIEYLIKYKPKKYFKPGKRHEYSNTGYVMLSSIIEKVSGMSYNDFLEVQIFKTLGMSNTRVYNTRRSKNENIPNYALGYVYSESLKSYVIPDSLSEYDYVYYLDGITGDGTVNSSISDLALWEQSLRQNKIVSKETTFKAFENKTLKSGEPIDYGYGWSISNKPNDHHIAHHSGSWPGYVTFIIHFVNEDKSIVVLTNNEYYNIDKFANKIALLLVK